eukprot:7381761-Prymnesium_polylepis.3
MLPRKALRRRDHPPACNALVLIQAFARGARSELSPPAAHAHEGCVLCVRAVVVAAHEPPAAHLGPPCRQVAVHRLLRVQGINVHPNQKSRRQSVRLRAQTMSGSASLCHPPARLVAWPSQNWPRWSQHPESSCRRRSPVRETSTRRCPSICPSSDSKSSEQTGPGTRRPPPHCQ